MSETFEAYAARILALSQGVDPFTVLDATSSRIAALLKGRTAEDVQWTPSADRWSIAQIVSHLADAEIVYAYRARMILANSGTPIQAFNQDEWVRSQHAERSDPHVSLALFTAIRQSTVRLMRTLTDDELERYGMHAERGRETIRHLLSLYAGHDLNHLGQIERLLAARQ